VREQLVGELPYSLEDGVAETVAGSVLRARSDGTPAARTVTVLAASGIGKSFGASSVLERLDLEIPERVRIGVIGANGSGKSTLLRYFLDRIADRIVEVRDGEVRSFEGGYSDWARRAGREAAAAR